MVGFWVGAIIAAVVGTVVTVVPFWGLMVDVGVFPVIGEGVLEGDATKVQANASLDSLTPRFAVEAHLANLFGAETEGAQEEIDQRIADLQVSTTDPDATIMLHKDGSHLGYQTHYVVDDGRLYPSPQTAEAASVWPGRRRLAQTADALPYL